MFLAEVVDPIQIAIIVIAMLGGFVQWLWGLYQQNREEAARRRTIPLSEEEKRLREEAWQRQVQNTEVPKPKPPVNDPWATMREVLEQIKKEASPPQVPTPVHRPQNPSSQMQKKKDGTTGAALRPAPVPAPVAPAVPVPETTPPMMPALTSTREASVKQADGMAMLRELLGTQASIRQAVLMREILGPPKALQSSGDSTI